MLDALVEFSAAKKQTDTKKLVKSLKEKGDSAITGGMGSQQKNVEWGSKAGSHSVDPKKIQKSFADS